MSQERNNHIVAALRVQPALRAGLFSGVRLPRLASFCSAFNKRKASYTLCTAEEDLFGAAGQAISQFVQAGGGGVRGRCLTILPVVWAFPKMGNRYHVKRILRNLVYNPEWKPGSKKPAI